MSLQIAWNNKWLLLWHSNLWLWWNLTIWRLWQIRCLRDVGAKKTETIHDIFCANEENELHERMMHSIIKFEHLKNVSAKTFESMRVRLGVIVGLCWDMLIQRRLSKHSEALRASTCQWHMEKGYMRARRNTHLWASLH